MAQRLLVKEPFGAYERGDRITAAAEIKRVTKSHPNHVLREDVPEQPKRRGRKAGAAQEAKPKASRRAKPAAPVSEGVVITDPAPGGEAAKG